MSDIRILVPSSTSTFQDIEDGRPSPRKHVRVTARPSVHQSHQTMFEKLGAPTNLLEWAEWYHEYRSSRNIPARGLLPAVALDLRQLPEVRFGHDDREPTEAELMEIECEEIFS